MARSRSWCCGSWTRSSIPVMAKCRIGHFVEARVLEALGVDFIDESEVLTPGRRGAPRRQARLHGAVRVRLPRPGRGAAPHRRRRGADAHQGRGRHRQRRGGGAPPARGELGAIAPAHDAAARGADGRGQDSSARPTSWCSAVAETGRLPVPNFAAGGIATPADAALMMRLGRRVGVRRLRHLQVAATRRRARARSCAPPRTGRTPRWWPRSLAAWASAMPGLATADAAGSRAPLGPRLVRRVDERAFGVLALQGDFAAHAQALRDAGAVAREVRRAAELEGLRRPGAARAARARPCCA